MVGKEVQLWLAFVSTTQGSYCLEYMLERCRMKIFKNVGYANHVLLRNSWVNTEKIWSSQ